MMRRLACCRRRTKDFSIDLDEHDRVMTYSGLESCILNSCSYDNESGGSGMSRSEGCAVTDSLDEDCTSCSSSKEALCSSFSSLCLVSRKQEEEHLLDEWETIHNLHLCSKGKVPITYTMRHLDVQTMKERFVKLLLGEDIYGGAKGISASLALSNAIISLSVSVFGELWKLEPLSEDRKNRWRREMDWLLSPTNYMVELVPAKQRGSSGRMLEIMTPKTRSDIHVNLPALQKLDSMLIDVLDSMVETEFWYVEGGSRDDDRSSGIRTSKRWWLPSPMVPEYGLSPIQRKRLGIRAKLVNQVLKAAKSINEQVLLEMPIPEAVTDALPKTGRASLGEEIYRAITAEPYSIEETLLFMNLRSEHAVLEALNRLEGAFLAWKQRISNEETKRSQVRYPWHFAARDGRSDVGRMEVWMERIGMLVRLLKNRFPNLPQTFIEVTKVQYNKDVGHSILEAYSRVIVNLAFSILSRIGDILQEDDLKKPSTPIATLKFDFFSDVYLAGIKETPPGNIRRSLIDQMNNVDGRHFHNTKRGQEAEQWPQGVHQVTEPAPMEA